MRDSCYAIFLLALFCASGGHAGAAESSPTYEHQVRPILKEYCFDCHGADRELKAALDLRLRRSLVAGGESGAAIVPGYPEKSLLVERLRRGEMPPSGKNVPDEMIAVIERWIRAGAPTAGEEPESLAPGEVYITAEERSFWAFQAIERPRIVAGTDPRLRTGVDAVIAAVSPPGFQFAPEADRRTLIRRATLGLTGLPPTQAETAAFLQDTSPDAYEALLDRLLGSPHYGERWGRHWLDVAGYADSEGATNRDAGRPWAWKYRDYVIRAFNQDKPFDQFIREQLAGDAGLPRPYKNLNPEQIDALTATGFLRMAADGTGSGEDGEAARNKTLGDTVKIVSSAFLGLTVACAQCHDHRYDPIPQRDYFQLRAIFEPALNPKQWRTPAERLLSLYTDADHAKAAAVEAEARALLDEKAHLQERSIAEALAVEVERFPSALREPLRQAHRTPGAERTEVQRALLGKFPSANITRGNLYQYNKKAADAIAALDARVAKIRSKKPFHAYLRALTEPSESATDSRLHHRGDHRQPVGEALRAAGLTITAPPGERFIISEGAPHRRAAFARWLTSGRHPLVARVLVNRFWMHHFGVGLVETAGDFGVLGTRPANQPLLDYLAHAFMASGWRLKHLHRLILRSTVYRQQSSAPQAAPGLSAFGLWPLQRLDAETIRDRTLAVSGALDRTFFGEPVPLKSNDAGQFSLELPRRSVYGNVRRSQPVTLLHSFDAPVMETNCDRRMPSNSATQALMVMNGDFHVENAQRFAERILRESGGVGCPSPVEETGGRVPADAAWQVSQAFLLAYGRPVDGRELRSALVFLDRQRQQLRESDPSLTPERAECFALARLCHALISSNEFLYVD